MQDPCNVWNGKAFQFTLKKITEIISEKNECSIPDKFKAVENDIVNRVTADNMPAKKGVRVLFDLSWNKSEEESEAKVIEYIKYGVIVFSNRSFVDEKGQKLDTIYVKDSWEAWISIGKYVKAVFPMPTIGITGSTGKTTCTMFAQSVFNERYNTFISGEDGKNYNTTLSIVNQWILRANDEYNFHIQECGGETPRLIESSARVIDVDAFAINNIDTRQHIATYGTPENLIKDKTSFDRVRKESTFGVINLDDEILKNYKFESPIITYAINDESADYVGKNIRQNGSLLEFDVVSESESVHIKINIIGKYNVYNALMIFALAKQFGLTNDEIQRGFLKYKSIGIRQNLREVAGRLLYMDCYNASPESTELAVKTLSEIERGKRNRRIAIIGERKAANDDVYKINYELGKALAKYNEIDEYIIIGEDPSMVINKDEVTLKTEEDLKRGRGIYDGLVSSKNNNNVWFCDDLKKLALKLRWQTEPGDAILFKGRVQLALWSIADIAFGTDYTKSKILMPVGIPRELIKNKEYRGFYYKYFDGIDLVWGQNGFDNTKLIVPDYLENRYVVRISESMFKNNTQIREVIFGSRIRAIGDEAFYNCTNFEELLLPQRCMYIGEKSFYNCKNMIRATALNVQHISAEAFKNCSRLKEIVLSEKCMTIEEGAFENCPELTLKAPAFSYAEKYAKSHNIKFEEIDSAEERRKIGLNGTRREPNIYSVAINQPLTSVITPKKRDEDNSTVELSVAFAGDIMAHDIHLTGLFDQSSGLYDFHKLFERTSSYFKNADVAVGNLETTFGYGQYSAFPRFNTPETLAEAMADAGFDIAAIANNHMYDSNYAGIIKTKKVLEANGLDVSGVTFSDERGFALTERKGVKIAVLNYTYLTGSVDGKETLNLHILDEESKKIINTFSHETLDDDLKKISKAVLKAKEEADIVIMFYHWGSEYETKANILQHFMAYKTAEMGVDAVIGSHAHVIQEESSIEVTIDGEKKKVPVFYGLGNYCWGGRTPRTLRETVHNGIIASLEFVYNKKKHKVESIKTGYVPLSIKNDFILNKYDFSVLPLNDMNRFEVQAFDIRSAKTVQDIKNEIEKQLHPECIEDTKQYAFDKLIAVRAGEKLNVIKEYFPELKGSRIISQNAAIASALSNGEIVGNKKGICGMAFIGNGHTTEFVVKVIGENSHRLPVLVDENNMIADVYRPAKLCSGISFRLGAVSLEEQTALAWKGFYEYANANKIPVSAIRGYETNERQLKTIINKSEREESPLVNEDVKLGYSLHNLGTAIDVAIKESDEAEIEKAIKWILNNAYKFGFYVAKVSEEPTVHMNYIGDIDEAKVIQSAGGNIEKYLCNYELYKKKVQKRKAWMNRYISEKERKKDREHWDVLTLKRICDIIGIKVPPVYRSIEDRVVPGITINDINVRLGSIFFYDNTLLYRNLKLRNAMRKACPIAITDRVLKDEVGNVFNQIIVEDSFKACAKVLRYLLSRKGCDVIAVSESGSDRTLLKVLNEIISLKYDVIANSDASNGRIGMVDTIQKVREYNDFYIQEIECAVPGLSEENIYMLSPKIAVFTGIKEKHAKNYDSYEEYKKESLRLIDFVTENGGTAFVNIDEQYLKKYERKNNIRTISLKNKNADYYMSYNIKKDYAEAMLYCKIEKEVISLRIKEAYLNDMMSLLAAFAAARFLGIKEYDFIQSEPAQMGVIRLPDLELNEFKSSIAITAEGNSLTIKWKRNLKEVSGYHIRAYDCYGRLVKGVYVKKNGKCYFDNLCFNSGYTVKIRGYSIINGYKLYSKYVSLGVVTEPISTEHSKIEGIFTERRIYAFDISWRPDEAVSEYIVSCYDVNGKLIKQQKPGKDCKCTFNKLKAGNTYIAEVKSYIRENGVRKNIAAEKIEVTLRKKNLISKIAVKYIKMTKK